MKLSWTIALTLALCSCQSRNPPANSSAPEEPKSETARKSEGATNIVVLDQSQQQAAQIRWESVRARGVAANLDIPGSLTNNEDQTWHVGAIASGRIEAIFARVGDSVTAGQTLGRIHSHEVHEARAGYREAVTEVERSQAAEEYAKQRRDRAQRLLDLKAGSRQDLESADADLRNAQAAIEKARSELEKERAHLEIFHLPAEENAEEDDIPVLAPAPGVVIARNASTGSVVTAGDELFAITDTNNLWMIANANEEDLSRLHAEQQVRIEVRAYPGRRFPGRILKLGERLDPETRTLQIRILVPNPNGYLKPEMYATASVQESGGRSGLFVPEEAIQDIDGVSVVFVRRNPHEFEARAVKRGGNADGETEILEGLRAGEPVIVKGGFLLKSQMLKSSIQESN
jgi:cobalt-zinc-cadmium efflux system membrane fusion protein